MPQKMKAVTVRMTPELYVETAELAQARGVSLNQMLVESLERRLESERHARLYDAFTLLGQDAEEASVEFASEVQREILGDG